MWGFSEEWDCGYNGNFWGAHALKCLPEDVWKACEGRLAFVSTTESDGRRLTKEFSDGRDVIVLSERIVPKDHANENSPQVRYFMFAVLHEIAHAFMEHLPPSKISREENETQEVEANELAFEWLNGFIRTKNRVDYPEFTAEELGQAQAASAAAMKAALGKS